MGYRISKNGSIWQQSLNEHFPITLKNKVVIMCSHGLLEYHSEISSSRDTG